MALLLVQALAGVAIAQPTRADLPAGTVTEDRIVPLEATVNGDRAGAWPFVERQGNLYVGQEALEEWRVRMPTDVKPIRVRGTDFYPLAGVPGFTARINYTNLSVEINFSPEAFSGTRLQLETELKRPKPSPVLPSTFLNYDLNFQRSTNRTSSSQDLGAVLEFGASNDWGAFTSSEVGRNLTGRDPSQKKEWLRLESTFTHNFPERNLTLRLGDATTRPGLWGRNVYFGGLQFGTNFALSPGYLTQPLPLLTGISSAPSTVELYVNDVLRQVSQVPTGPFVIDNTQGLTGSGEARLVVRDVLGREVVIVQPFFTSAQLLAPGLNDWSVELGSVRHNLGTTNADYGQGFSTGTWRRGITDTLTLEGRGEVSTRHRAFGLGAIGTLPTNVLLRASLARSQHDRAGAGQFWLLGIERQWIRTALSVQMQGASVDYRELGMSDSQFPTRRQLAANLSQQLDGGNVSLGFARVERYDASPVTTLSLNYAHRFETATLNANVSRAFGNAGGTSVGMTLQVPLDRQRIASASVNSHAGVTDVYATAFQFANDNSDIGWRVLGGRLGNEAHAEAGVDYTGRYGHAYADMSDARSQNSQRIGASGGVAAAAGHLFFSKRLDESFGVVELKGYPGIGVGLGSTVSTTTDGQGIAFIPYLSPFQGNQVRLDARDLPISAQLDSIERVVVPSWRSAVKVDFPVRTGRAALVKLQQEDGEPVPAGAQVQIRGDSEEFIVGRRGEAFITGLASGSELRAHWKDHACMVALTLPASNDDVVRVGPLTCKAAR